jgi:hypothetical protein
VTTRVSDEVLRCIEMIESGGDPNAKAQDQLGTRPVLAPLGRSVSRPRQVLLIRR